ncbi:putative baseplate assembly protein [Nocardioides sp. LMS-CY]|uniref:Putative phage baseplate assembly protein n=1 Tax=Nocardioides soli TaxID=1036020 RepID=A0A7W4VUV6_9ACTN|nr:MULTISPECIES: putative baseplate assembly protein [Nocardioides]MBB3041804.1 putative phage baseplate assembly protein [Nocardioides soli]QWF21318.1 putative baseplate assembly protein [Nocardioides sp. LMS-CY]
MPLPTPALDDRTFQDIVDEAKRLIPRYCPEWTNHNVSDPGVALIELFAWMSEMVLYRVNQVPDRLFVHFLNMVGIEPFPPSVARTDLTFWLSAVLEQPVLVPENTPVMTQTSVAETDSVVFTTTQDLLIAPPELVAAKSSSVASEQVTDVWEDLRFGTDGARCFSSDPLTPGDAFYLGFSGTLAGMVVSLRVEAQAEGIGVDPRNPPLLWEVWNGEGWLPARVHEDTTGGLNRPGEVILMVPVEHEPLTVANESAYWLRARLLAPRAGQPTYRNSPRVRGLEVSALGGTVAAEHAEVIGSETLGRSNGAPAQTFQVGRHPVLPRRSDETVRIVDGTRTHVWQEVEDFSASGPDDRHYVWDSGTGVIHFGPRIRYPDGSVRQHGAIPRDGAFVEVSGYRHGGGSRGNVGARTLSLLRNAVPFVNGVINLAPASGGVDAETVAEAKARGPLTLRTGQRAVTARDFERLTLESSIEVARARCRPAGRGNGAVQLLVVPHVRSDPTTHQLDDFAISQQLMGTITDALDEHRLVGTAVEVSTPYYQGVSVVALVHGAPGRPAALVRQRAMDTLARFLNPLVGGSDGTGWPFDADVNLAVVTQLLESVDGVERVDEVLLYEYDLRTGRRLGGGKDVVRLDKQSLFLSAGHQVVVR